MEQHPVPQNISSFQFKLIGDMTIRQFIYLAGGILSGYFILQLDWNMIIKWFLAAIVAGGGFSFAFIPIEERPLDRWLVSFFKRVYSPTQFLWKKKPAPPEILTSQIAVSSVPTPETLKKEATAVKLEEYLMTLPTAPIGELDEKELGFLGQISSLFTPSLIRPLGSASLPPEKPEPPAVAPPSPIQAPTQTTTALPAVEDIDKKTQGLTAQIASLQEELNRRTITHERFLEIQAQLASLSTEKERLSRELIELRRRLAEKQPEEAVRPTAVARVQEESRVKIVSSSMAPKIGVPKVTTIPNIISGIVKTQRGTILPGILVEIRNQEGTPVRALKTGKLGQFAISTPLANGIYTLHLEDPQKTFYFDIIELALTGEVVSALEIFAKTQKDKIKEELRKKLFSQNNF